MTPVLHNEAMSRVLILSISITVRSSYASAVLEIKIKIRIKRLVGDVPFHLKFALKVTPALKNADFSVVFVGL